MPRLPSRQRAVTLRIKKPTRPPAGPSKARYEEVQQGTSPASAREDEEDAQESQDEGNDDDDDEDDLGEDPPSPPSDSGDSADEWVPESVKTAKGKGKQSSASALLGVEGDSEDSGEEVPSPAASSAEDDDDAESSKGRRSKVASAGTKRKGGSRTGSAAKKKRWTEQDGTVYSGAEDDPELRPIAPGSKSTGKQPTEHGAAGSSKGKGKHPLQLTAAERELKKLQAEEKRKARRQETQDAKELREAQQAADAAWQAVRAKKTGAAAGGPAEASGSGGASAAASSSKGKDKDKGGLSLSSWLGLAPKASDVPMPTTCTAAQIADRDSLFIGYVYPLETASSHVLSALLTHLAKVVHPHHVPIDLLPPNLRGAPPERRGSSHDMYALRVLALKPGRSGAGGPEDFAVTEQNEDDGEKWSSQHILRVMQEEGASDCLCIVSRWYGGTMLGPDRFKHIAACARAALREHQLKEQLQPLVEQLVQLDDEVLLLKFELKGTAAGGPSSQPAPSYNDLTLEKAQRLVTARENQIRALQRMIDKQRDAAGASSQGPSAPSS